MITQKILFLGMLVLSPCRSAYAIPLAEQFKLTGYRELRDEKNGAATFDALYTAFDDFIAFLHVNPIWAQKLYTAKERFIRSKDKCYYSTDFFGFYDESERVGRNQISFYYSTRFHDFICSYYPEFNRIAEVMRFLEQCREIQAAYGDIFIEAAAELGVETVFISDLPILFKVIKYFPAYTAARPHYDGTAFSIFLDSTDNESLLLSPYKAAFTRSDFSSPARIFSREQYQNSILLIPGTLLQEFSIDPTPHIVVSSGNIRYATIAFAMRPHHIFQKNELSLLPHFNR